MQGHAVDDVEGLQLVVVIAHDVLDLDAVVNVRLAELVLALRRLLAEGCLERSGSARVSERVRLALELRRLGRELGVEVLGVAQW